MRVSRFFSILVAPVASLITVACSDSVGPPTMKAPSLSQVESERLIEVAVGYRDSVRPTDLEFLAMLTNKSPTYKYRGFPGLVVKLPVSAVKTLRSHPRVRFVDTGNTGGLLAEASGYQFQSFPFGHGIDAVHSDASFGDARFGDGIGIAILDSGIDCVFVSDFPNCAGGFDFTGEGNAYEDRIGHGTRVASLITSYDGNAIGIRGIAHKARIFSLKVADSLGGISCIRSSAAIDYAVYDLSTEVSILNMSYYTRRALTVSDSLGYEQDCSAERISISNAVAAERFLSISAGNIPISGDSIPYPARLPGVAAVGGLTCSSFSGASCAGTGLTRWSGSPRGDQLSFVASAANMYVLEPASNLAVVKEGTSYSAPVVSGIVALVQARYNKPRTGKCMLQHLKNTASRRSGWIASSYGAGAVRADVAWSTNPASDPVTDQLCRTSGPL